MGYVGSWGDWYQSPRPSAEHEGSLDLAPKPGEAQRPTEQASGCVSKDAKQSISPGTWGLPWLSPWQRGGGCHFFPKVEAAGRTFPKGETPVPKMPAPQVQGTAGKALGGPGEARALPVTTA